MTKMICLITFFINHIMGLIIIGQYKAIIGLKNRSEKFEFPNFDRLDAENAQF